MTFPTPPAAMFVEVLSRFPARVVSGVGIKTTYANGTLSIGFDFAALPVNPTPSPTAQYKVLIYDTVSGAYQAVALSNLISFASLLVGLPTTLPGTPGILWNDNGSLSIS